MRDTRRIAACTAVIAKTALAAMAPRTFFSYDVAAQIKEQRAILGNNLLVEKTNGRRPA